MAVKVRLSEEEKKRAKRLLDVMQKDNSEEEIARKTQEEKERVDRLFSENIEKNGERDTNKHTISIGELRKAYKGLPAYNAIKKSTDELYEKRKKEQEQNNLRKKRDNRILEEAEKKSNEYNTYIQNIQKAKKENDVLPTAKNKLNLFLYNNNSKKELNNSNEKLLSTTSPAELEANNIPILSNKDPRLKLQSKRSWEYNAKDYNDLAELNQVVSQKQADNINKMAKENPVGAFALNTIMNTTGGMGQSIFGINNAVNTAGSVLTKGIEKVAQITGNEELEKKAKETYDKRIAEGNYMNNVGNFISSGNQGVDNGIIKTAGDVSSTIGRQLMDFAVGSVTGIKPINLQGIEVAGGSSQEVLNENPDNIVQAVTTGVAKGYIAKKLEDLFDANILTIGSKQSSVQNQVTKWISNTFKSKAGKEIADKVTGVVGENIEEFLEDNIDNVVDKLINNKDLPNFEEWWNNTTNTVKTTTLSTIAMQLLGFGGDNFANKEAEINSEANFWVNEAQNIINNNGYTIQTQNDTNKLNKLLSSLENKKSIEEQIQGLTNNSTLNQTNLQSQQITQLESNIAQNQNIGQIEVLPKANSNIENNQQVLYNNNESEGGINEREKNGQRASGVLGQLDTRIQQKSKPQQSKKYTKSEYKQWEQSIKSTSNSEITIEQKQLKNDIKGQYGKDIVFFDGNENDYNGGASLSNSSSIYINKNDISEFGIKKIALHEVLESNIAHNLELKNDIINPTIKAIVNDSNFQEQKNKFWLEQEGEMPSDYMIAKDILCDRFAEIKSREQLDYDNVLSQETNMTIDFAIENFEKQIDSNKLLATQKQQAPSIKNNTLETGEYTKEQNRIEKEQQTEDKIASILEQSPEKVKEKDRKWAILKANLVDKGIVFEELSHKVKNRELQGKWDYTLTSMARGQYAIGNARYEMNPKNKTQKQISKSLEDIRTEVGNKTNEFSQYMYHQLNIDRMSLEERFAGDTGINYERKNDIKNKPVFGKSVTADISQKIINQYEQKNPEFKKWAQDIYDFNNANKRELVKNGVISQELADRLNELYPHYVPIKRIDTNGNAIKVPLDTNRTGINTPMAKAKGGNSDIFPLFETMADRTLQTYRASARNNFGVELMNTLNSVQDTQITDIDTILEEIGDIDSNKEFLQEGKKGNAPTFTVFNNGEKVTFEITQDMYDALKPLNDSSILSKTFKIPNKISNFRRGVLTEYNPLFLITNALKDVPEVLTNSQHALKTYSKFPEAYVQIVKKGYWYNEYVRNGGEQNSYFKDGKFESDIKENKAKSAVTLPLRKTSELNNVIETAPRLAEYIASREKGTSIETSMLDAARVTTNFKAGGDVTKWANRNGATFLNASVQGAAQQIRNITEANTKGLKGYAVLATKYAIAGLPALILNNLIWKDDEEYDELQDYVKDNYYIVGKYGDGKFIRIPKGRTMAVIQKLVNNVSEYISKEKELNIDNFAKDFWGNLQFTSNNLAPNNPIDNNVLSPIIQAITGKSWNGGDIVPKRLQDKPKAEQYDESIDSLSIWMGQKLNVSPYKINYLLDQYGGGISDVLLPSMTKQAENNVIEDKFTTDSVMKNKYPGEFYSKLDEVKVNNNSENATDEDKLKYKHISGVSKELSDLYKEKREIQNSNLLDKEKKEKLKVVQRKINEIAEMALNNLNELNVSDNTATIEKQQYYKDGEGKWNVLDKKEISKNSNISTSTFADYKQKLYYKTQEKRKNGELTKEQNLKDKDKIEILVNSNYTNKEKSKLYENYILSSSDKKYSIVKEVFTTDGLNIDKYLKYKVAESNEKFKANKKDDGSIKGKSISGSAKEKRRKYIDSIKGASYTQKVLLFALNCKPSKQSDKDIVYNYIQNLPRKTVKEELDILSNFEGVTIYKDGTFKY